MGSTIATCGPLSFFSAEQCDGAYIYAKIKPYETYIDGGPGGDPMSWTFTNAAKEIVAPARTLSKKCDGPSPEPCPNLVMGWAVTAKGAKEAGSKGRRCFDLVYSVSA